MGLDQYAWIVGPEVDRDFIKNGERELVKRAFDNAEDFYWRKHSKLQSFMETLFAQQCPGEDLNCDYLFLDRDDLKELMGYLTGPGLPQSEGGFFWGHQFQDEAKRESREYDIAFVQKALAALDRGDRVVYSCWY